MKTIRVSATNARNNFFNLLNQVMYEDLQVIIGKAGTDRQVILEQQTSSKEEYEKNNESAKGDIRCFKEYTSFAFE